MPLTVQTDEVVDVRVGASDEVDVGSVEIGVVENT